MAVFADKVLLNGTLLTCDGQNSIASAIAIRDDRILAVGTDEEIKRLVNDDTVVIFLDKRTVVPGFMDIHVHMGGGMGGIEKEVSFAYPDVKSIEDIRRIVAQAVREVEPGEWIVGRGWEPLRMAEGRHPTRLDVDDVSPDNPVIMISYSAHLMTLNGEALRRVGIDKNTSDPPGGEIERDGNGEPTGYITESVRNLVNRAIPQAKGSKKERLRKEASYLNSLGITSAHEATGRDPAMVHTMQEMVREGDNRLRYGLMLRRPMGLVGEGWTEQVLDAGFTSGFGDEWVRLGPVKINVDGSSIGGGAANPERDNYEEYIYVTQEELDRVVADACMRGCQVNAHATGEIGIEMFVTAVERAMEKAPRPFAPHRIEHCNFLNDDLIKRIARANIIPVVQPSFLWSFGLRYEKTYGRERAENMKPLRTFLDNGITFVGTSDASVMSSADRPMYPLHGISQMMTRRTAEGDVLGPDQVIDFWSALRAYTINAAIASGEENIKGSLEAGKLADLVILDGDLPNTPAEQMPDIEVEATMVGGNIVYERTHN